MMVFLVYAVVFLFCGAEMLLFLGMAVVLCFRAWCSRRRRLAIRRKRVKRHPYVCKFSRSDD